MMEKERVANIFSTLGDNSLISLPIFADNGCKITLNNTWIDIHHDGVEAMKGYHERSTRLWRVGDFATTKYHC